MSAKIGFCHVALSPVRLEAKDSSEMVTQLLFGELLEIVEIQDNWTKIRVYTDNYEGWIDTKQFKNISDKEARKWLDEAKPMVSFTNVLSSDFTGIIRIPKGSWIGQNSTFNIGNHFFELINEDQDVENTLWETALTYQNTPYLWGGKSPWGIDCSGLTQQVFKFHNINLPRDASQQVDYGQSIDFADVQAGDLAFFSNPAGKITHVGIIGENRQIVHASGWVRIDLLKQDGIYNSKNEKTHQLAEVKRV